MKIEHEYTQEIICPWCGYEHGDSWEHLRDSDDNFQCNDCDKYFSYERDIEVTYSTQRKKCKDKCSYELDKDKVRNPYIYKEQNWTIWICNICHDKIIKVGKTADDKEPYLQNIEEPNVR